MRRSKRTCAGTTAGRSRRTSSIAIERRRTDLPAEAGSHENSIQSRDLPAEAGSHENSIQSRDLPAEAGSHENSTQYAWLPPSQYAWLPPLGGRPREARDLMRRTVVLIFALAAGLAFAQAKRPQPPAGAPLKIYFIDVEGGQSTLFVTPSGESMLIDTGYPGFGGRDANRVLAAVEHAGVSRLDYL